MENETIYEKLICFYRLTKNFSFVFYIANNDSNFWKWCPFYIKKPEPVAAEVVLNCYF